MRGFNENGQQSLLFVAIGFLLCCVAYEYPPDYGPNLCRDDIKTPLFNFIVCGGGSAGATLASRLSEEPSWNVLLLERGADPPEFTETPILWASSLKTPIDYQYISELDERFFKGLENERSSIPRGKVSGGCSTINVGMYVRGNEQDFNRWEASGCKGWNYESVIKYFLKAEDYHGSPDFDRNIHSIGGPLTVTPYLAPDPAIDIFARGFAELGVKYLKDINEPQPIGYGFSDSTTRYGLRCSSFKAYLMPAKFRKTLFYARNVLVRRVLFEEGDRGVKAVGVEITAPNGNTCRISAKNEVIISMGAIASPQALLLSGIGPKEHLESLNIPVIANLPVGKNYQDHPCFIGVVYSDRKNRLPEEIKRESDQLIYDTYKLTTQGISTMGMTKLVAFLDTKNKNTGVYPDIQLMVMRISQGTMMKTGNGRHKLYNMFGFSQKTADLFTELNDETDTIFIIVILLDLKSTGIVELASINAEEHPKIYPQLIHHPDEVETLLRGVKIAHRLSNTTAFREYGLQLEHIPYEACTQHKKGSKGYYICAVEQIMTGFYHPGCTVKMGAEEDESAVLNPRLQVKGVAGLRVVDASSMPLMVSANPNAAVIMMAEKAADMIKEDHNKTVDYKANLS